MNLQDKIIAHRKANGWSQEDFADMLHVSRQAVSRWENGTALPDVQNLLQISRLFHVTADYLLHDEYGSDSDIPAVRTAAKETEALWIQKKKLHLVAAISFLIASFCWLIGLANSMSFMNGSVGWSDDGILIPYRFWKLYGDDALIREHWEGMKRYARFMMGRCGKWTPLRRPVPLKGEAAQYVVNFGQSYGEWAEPADVFPNDWKNTVLPHPEESTAYTSYVLGLMAELAGYLGEPEAQKEFARYRDGCAAAYRELAALPEYGLDTDRQARLVRPLSMRLLDAEQTAYAKKRLVGALDAYGWRLGTGFLSTPLILYVLAEIDIEYAYRLLENEELPGWLAMPKNGATTIWEDWAGPYGAQGGIASLNHYSKGAVVEWLFTTMCGIRVDGENHFTVAPRPGGHFTHADARYVSVYGEVESGWRKTEGGTAFTVAVPAGCTARVRLPDGSERVQTAGAQTYLISEG